MNGGTLKHPEHRLEIETKLHSEPATPSNIAYRLNDDGKETAEPKNFKHTAKILTFFFLWYVLSVGYNIFNKDAMNLVPLPWLIGTFQLFAGIPLFSTLWLFKFRKAPILSGKDILKLLPVVIFHCGAHICAVLSMHSTSVSFAQIIKSGEPVFTAGLSAILGEILSWKVYTTLIPVVSGVAIASISEPQFSWTGLFQAMGANLFSSLRGVYSKRKIQNPIGENLDARNLYGVITIMSFSIVLPIALIIEGSTMVSVWNKSMETASLSMTLFKILASGFCYYTYNEVAFSTLELVSPVTHAVGSTFKRVFIIGFAIVRFGTYPEPIGYVGIVIAIAGVCMYSLAKQKYKVATKADN